MTRRIVYMVGLTVLVSVCSQGLVHAAYVVTTQGKKIEGTDIRSKSNGDIILQTDVGSRTFLKGQYVQAVADKPEDFDQARKLIEMGKYDQALPILNNIISKYNNLSWDDKAQSLLPDVYVGKGDYPSAVSAYEELFKNAPKAKEGDMVWSYREVLIQAKQYGKLSDDLDEVIKTGPRSDAAKAQIMRGDIARAKGQVEPAALDYLRTVVLFKDAKEQQAEANFKAAEMLEQLRDRRAQDLYRVVAQEYPNSPYAKPARAKM